MARTLGCRLRGRGKAPSELLRLRQHTSAGGGLRGGGSTARSGRRPALAQAESGGGGRARAAGGPLLPDGDRAANCKRGRARVPQARASPATGLKGAWGANPGPWGWWGPHLALQLPHQPLGGRPQAIRQHSGRERATRAPRVEPRDPAAPTDLSGEGRGGAGRPASRMERSRLHEFLPGTP